MYLGIDLGTSNSAVATVRDGKAIVLKTPENTDVMPSVIHVDRRGNRSVGVRAYDQAILSPDNVAQRFKRLMGTASVVRFAASGLEMSPEDASAEILRTMVGNALLEAGTEVVIGAIVTIPAAFNQLQREATLAAARAAGLDRVGLVQEPVAAALAAMATSKTRSGQFLVYDLGGGTFDLALVQAVNGTVEVVAHEGINMLGGTDFDRLILDNLIRPWLAEHFALPAAWQSDKRFERLARVGRLAAERAKIDLSTRMATTINASDDIVRLEDERGEPIYLDVPMTREVLEELVADRITQSIELCRKIIADSGYAHDDIDRVVLVGGPTKMPTIRSRVEAELGIAVEDIGRVDPMTAVALGAAIFCEGRDWSQAEATAKSTQASVAAGGAIRISCDHEARSAGTRARVRIARVTGPDGCAVQVNSDHGDTTGHRNLDAPVELTLDLPDGGPNRFTVTVFDPAGRPVPDAGTTIVIDRVLAMAAGIPVTKEIAVKVEDANGGNTLKTLVDKGRPLPAKGVLPVRAAQTVRAGFADTIRVELFEVDDPSVRSPEHNLMIGEFRIRGEDLPQGQTLRRGEEINILWSMDAGQNITTRIEIESLEQVFDQSNFYNWQIGRQSFDGEDGVRLAAEILETAQQDVDLAEETLPAGYGERLRGWRIALEDLREQLRATNEADGRKQIADQARAVRQRVASAMARPDARMPVLASRLEREIRFYARDVRAGAPAEANAQVDQIIQGARQDLATGTAQTLDQVERMIGEIDRLYWRFGFMQFGFCKQYWDATAGDRHLARDRALFDTLRARGNTAARDVDLDGLRSALAEHWGNTLEGSSKSDVSRRASIMQR